MEISLTKIKLICVQRFFILETDLKLVKSFVHAVNAGEVITVNQMLQEGMPVAVSVNGQTALHYAIVFNKTDVVKLLLFEGADVNIQSQYDNTLCTWPCKTTTLKLPNCW